ncbi:16S rRNA (guanine527-N7)-methyltransferase [Roseivivax halotolerans]|uniref:Ribosomal RNA small subunit methyltransferase G n=1 Tax=Roseivivax halotolerans TaxID=93684 RepID=A0A1I5VCH9_9RHOB|nr:16S rRNA (guanine(527)-N(7))-methyltransferase RsmG [Roseivivax halotolerans]SFQ05264.1 16S rRNA (guanine527-N7)-methyltransferase [Roseivivax halotolerans]
MSAFASVGDVSRETLQELERFEALSKKWTQRINLISKSSEAHIWERHILDSLQLVPCLPSEGRWLDIGSGGGYPAIVLAIAAKTHVPKLRFVLVESDHRKAAFLRTAIREHGLNAQVKASRIEALEPQSADTVSARALASISSLLDYAAPHLSNAGKMVFPKGANWQKEIEEASQTWSFTYEAVTSKTDPSSAIVIIGDARRV